MGREVRYVHPHTRLRSCFTLGYVFGDWMAMADTRGLKKKSLIIGPDSQLEGLYLSIITMLRSCFNHDYVFRRLDHDDRYSFVKKKNILISPDS